MQRAIKLTEDNQLKNLLPGNDHIHPHGKTDRKKQQLHLRDFFANFSNMFSNHLFSHLPGEKATFTSFMRTENHDKIEKTYRQIMHKDQRTVNRS